MNLRFTALAVAINAALTVALLAGYGHWRAPAPQLPFAVLDVAELYRLKEIRIAALLIKPDASEAERATALTGAGAFGQELTALIQTLPDECHCLVLARGAVLGPASHLPDLTPDVRRRLGL